MIAFVHSHDKQVASGFASSAGWPRCQSRRGVVEEQWLQQHRHPSHASSFRREPRRRGRGRPRGACSWGLADAGGRLSHPAGAVPPRRRRARRRRRPAREIGCQALAPGGALGRPAAPPSVSRRAGGARRRDEHRDPAGADSARAADEGLDLRQPPLRLAAPPPPPCASQACTSSSSTTAVWWMRQCHLLDVTGTAASVGWASASAWARRHGHGLALTPRRPSPEAGRLRVLVGHAERHGDGESSAQRAASRPRSAWGLVPESSAQERRGLEVRARPPCARWRAADQERRRPVGAPPHECLLYGLRAALIGDLATGRGSRRERTVPASTRALSGGARRSSRALVHVICLTGGRFRFTRQDFQRRMQCLHREHRGRCTGACTTRWSSAVIRCVHCGRERTLQAASRPCTPSVSAQHGSAACRSPRRRPERAGARRTPP